MKLFTPFTIPEKDNCDLCKIKTKKEKQLKIDSQINCLNSSIEKVLISFSTDLQLSVRGLWLEDQAKEILVPNCQLKIQYIFSMYIHDNRKGIQIVDLQNHLDL